MHEMKQIQCQLQEVKSLEKTIICKIEIEQQSSILQVCEIWMVIIFVNCCLICYLEAKSWVFYELLMVAAELTVDE